MRFSTAQIELLIQAIHALANAMLPVRENSYEAGQRQGLLDAAEMIKQMVNNRSEK